MKFKGVRYENDPILGNLTLDFRIGNKIASTVYIAGENGTGKTAILNSLFSLSNLQPYMIKEGATTHYSLLLSPEEAHTLSSVAKDIGELKDGIIGDDLDITLIGNGDSNWNSIKLFVSVEGKRQELSSNIFSHHKANEFFKLLFSDVAINFTPKNIDSVTSKNLDEVEASQKTTDNLATEITQLIIDIQALDDADLSQWARKNTGKVINQEILDKRISRFRTAFSNMFPTKKYEEIRNVNGEKQVVFSDKGRECFIGDLSSGEKQIVFRGGFFLKDTGSAAGAVGIIDEPEISLHPDWQLKIMNFYKSILGVNQASTNPQIIVATHSPFILHNYEKSSEKIIILKKAEDGSIQLEKEPKFYGWTHEEAIREAFDIDISRESTSPLILVEGETDEKYLNEAVAKLGINLKGAEIKWVGRVGERGDAEFTGDKALNHTLSFAKSNPAAIGRPMILLYDGDTHKPPSDHGCVAVRTMPFNNQNSMKKGIENLLRIPKEININEFTSTKEQIDDYGLANTIRKLDKTKLCDYLVEKSREGNHEELFEDFRDMLTCLQTDVENISKRFTRTN